METYEFNEVVRRRCQLINQVLDKKAEGYARGDRLSNFKKAGKCLSKSPEEVCMGLMIKQFVCVTEIVCDAPNSKKIALTHIDEKIGDTINYLILLEALLHERYGYKANTEIRDRVNETLKSKKKRIKK